MSAVVLELAVIAWGLVCGAALYEHVAMVPVWAKAPPRSLTIWHGQHRVRAERLWIPIHPITLALLALALGLSWSLPDVQPRLLIVLSGYVAILVVTNAWFVPELMRVALRPTGAWDAVEWRRRARRWERWSLVRGAVMLGLAWPLVEALRLT